MPRTHAHFAMHKPLGFSCSHNRAEAPIIDELLPPELREIGLQPVGRLDRDTSGLLILTTDGQLIHALSQPGQKVEKQYRVGFRGILPDDASTRCARGFRMDGQARGTLPAQLIVERPCRFQSARAPELLGEATLTLHEGRHHQVRRMFRALGASVVTLHRERVGGYRLPMSLAPGQLTSIDAAALFARLDESDSGGQRRDGAPGSS